MNESTPRVPYMRKVKKTRSLVSLDFVWHRKQKCFFFKKKKGKSGNGETPHQTDPHMHISVRQEPIHPGSLVRKHMRILPRRLGRFLCLRDGRAGIRARDAASIEAGRVGWRSEPFRLFQHDDFVLLRRGRRGEFSSPRSSESSGQRNRTWDGHSITKDIVGDERAMGMFKDEHYRPTRHVEHGQRDLGKSWEPMCRTVSTEYGVCGDAKMVEMSSSSGLGAETV